MTEILVKSDRNKNEITEWILCSTCGPHGVSRQPFFGALQLCCVASKWSFSWKHSCHFGPQIDSMYWLHLLFLLTNSRSIFTDLSFFGHFWKADGRVYISTGGRVWEFKIEADWSPVHGGKLSLAVWSRHWCDGGIKETLPHYTYWWCLASFWLSFTLLMGSEWSLWFSCVAVFYFQVACPSYYYWTVACLWC